MKSEPKSRQPARASSSIWRRPARGAWRDKFLADGSWIEEPAPGSSMYYITCALAELIDTAESGETKGSQAGRRQVAGPQPAVHEPDPRA